MNLLGWVKGLIGRGSQAPVVEKAPEVTLPEVDLSQVKVMPEGHPNAGFVYIPKSPGIESAFYVAPETSKGEFSPKLAIEFAKKSGARLATPQEFPLIVAAAKAPALLQLFDGVARGAQFVVHDRNIQRNSAFDAQGKEIMMLSQGYGVILVRDEPTKPAGPVA